jgi:hypothetical protein
LISVHPRLAIAFWLTSETLIPVITASRKVLLTSGWPNSDFAA